MDLTTFNVNRAPLDVEVDFPISKTGTDCTSEQLQDARATYRPRGIGLNDSTVFVRLAMEVQAQYQLLSFLVV